jgi:hypothetical protein
MAAFALYKLGGTSTPVELLINNLKANKEYMHSLEKCFEDIEDPRSVISLLIYAEQYPEDISHKLIDIMKNYLNKEDYSSWRKGHNLCWLAGQLRIHELTNELIKVTQISENHSTRNMATEALGKIGFATGKKGFKAILKRLRIKDEIYYRTRLHAAEALAKIGRKEAITELKKALNEEYEPIVRKEIERSIKNLRNKSNNKKV